MLYNSANRVSANNRFNAAFTLIELSIVLVIIGLIVGGVLVGRDLIKASAIRATIAQIEKYNSAVNTFRGKFEALPGDMNSLTATRFGFAARGPYAGEGDGNGVIEGSNGSAGTNFGDNQMYGETGLFWVDLSTAKLIDGSFNTATGAHQTLTVNAASTPNLKAFFPEAKLGRGNFIYVWSGGSVLGSNGNAGDGKNYFGIAAIASASGAWITSNSGLTPSEAFSIDSKMDDGMPQSGRMLAIGIYNSNTQWAGNSYPWSTAPSDTTCYDNNSAASGTPMRYTTTVNQGNGVNCIASIGLQ